jgi:hypothetical protein
MKTAISMRELQKMSAGAIQALPHAVPIKSGGDTVALLVPIHKGSPEAFERLMARIDALAASWTPEEKRKIEALLGEQDAP